jgi:hypothetical protein
MKKMIYKKDPNTLRPDSGLFMIFVDKAKKPLLLIIF